MKLAYLVLFVGVLTLTGAGCAGVRLPETSGTETTENESEAQGAPTQDTAGDELTPSSNADDQVEMDTTDETAIADTSPEEEEITEPESDQELESFFNYSVTHEKNYEAYQAFKKHSQRMNKAIVRASPAGIEKYEHSEWVKYDPEGLHMVNLGVEAAGAMLEAHVAFEAKSASTESLVTKAVNLVGSYYDSIIVFELKWGVSGE